MFDFAIEMYVDPRDLGKKSSRGKSRITLLKLPAIMAGSLKKSNTRWLSCDPNELCDRLNLLLQEEGAGNSSHIFNDEIIAITDKLLEYQCISNEGIIFYYLFV